MSSVNVQYAELVFLCVALSTSFERGDVPGKTQAATRGAGLKSMLFNLRELAAIRGTNKGSSHWEVCGPLGLTVSPGISVFSNDATANYSCSFCEVSSRSLGPTVSSAVKGAAEISGLMT